MKSVILKALIVLFLGVFVFSAVQFYRVTKTTNEEKQEVSALAEIVQTNRKTAQKKAQAKQDAGILALQKKNPDAFGWIKIEGTRVDYPVMFTPEDPQKYLRLTFSGKYSIGGVPFLDAAYFPGCGNAIIYGHRMDNGTMFADLQNYRDKNYFKSHRNITFTTLEGEKTYEIISVFLAKKGSGFLYYDYTDLTDPVQFEEYLQNVKALSLYDTGVTAVFGDALLTLSTCSYHTTDGRLAVVARQCS